LSSSSRLALLRSVREISHEATCTLVGRARALSRAAGEIDAIDYNGLG